MIANFDRLIYIGQYYQYKMNNRNQEMDEKMRKYVDQYLNDCFMEGLQKYEQTVHESQNQMERLSKNVLSAVCEQKNNNMLAIKQAINLQEGANKKIATQLTVLRVLWNNLYTFVLATSKFPPTHIQQLFCVVVETLSYNAPYNQSWKKCLGPNAILFIKQPYIDARLSFQIPIIRAPIENVQIKQQCQYRGDANEIKKLGNEQFKHGNFINALNYYEYALSCCHHIADTNTRTILYTNSAACLYKLNLFDSCLKYLSITSRIDRNHYKIYSWKIQCYLQKKNYGQIPNLLVVLQPKATLQDFSKINSKYSIYLSNSIGMYNWHQIISCSKEHKGEPVIANYFSRFISYTVHEDKTVYYALENIKKYSILIISKPIAFDRKGAQNQGSFCQRVLKCFKLQKSFSSNIKDLIYSSQIGRNGKNDDSKKIGQKQMSVKSIQRNVVKPKDITCNESQSAGIWAQLLRFTISCNPNCSIVHFDSILVVSASADIPKGQLFTIDLDAQVQARNRKSHIFQKYGRICKCQVCQFKSWPNLSNLKQVLSFSQLPKSNTIQKSFFWEIVQSQKSKEYQPIIQKMKQKIMNDINWNDTLTAVKIIRKKDQKYQKLLRAIILKGLRNFLKVSTKVCEIMINSLIGN